MGKSTRDPGPRVGIGKMFEDPYCRSARDLLTEPVSVPKYGLIASATAGCPVKVRRASLYALTLSLAESGIA